MPFNSASSCGDWQFWFSCDRWRRVLARHAVGGSDLRSLMLESWPTESVMKSVIVEQASLSNRPKGEEGLSQVAKAECLANFRTLNGEASPGECAQPLDFNWFICLFADPVIAALDSGESALNFQ